MLNITHSALQSHTNQNGFTFKPILGLVSMLWRIHCGNVSDFLSFSVHLINTEAYDLAIFQLGIVRCARLANCQGIAVSTQPTFQ